MEPIINPLWFYLADVCLAIKVIALCAMLPPITILFWQIILHIQDEEPIKYLKAIIVSLTISGLLSILVPSDKAVIQMMIAYQITPQNIDYAEEQGKSVTEFIAEIVNQINTGCKVKE